MSDETISATYTHDTLSSASSVLKEENTKQKKHEPSFIGEVLRLGVIALVIVLPFRLYVATPFQVSGASMSPTFETGNYLIIDRVTYLLESPARGDVIVFAFPKDPSKYFIKRLIAFPGEKVSVRDSTVYITKTDGELLTLKEPYIDPENISHDSVTLTLGPDEYFVLGDNRNASADSRVWGAVPKENIVGRVFLRLMPFNQIGIFPGKYPLTNGVRDATEKPDFIPLDPEGVPEAVRL